MSRSSIAGTTDYSHQTLEDILNDLDEWLRNLKFVQDFLKEHLQILQENGYWDDVIGELKSLLRYAMKFYDTSTKEITDIRREVEVEVQQHHVSRLNRLYGTANELNLEFGRVWHQELKQKDYGNENFEILEGMYARGRDMAVDMLDLSNTVERLADYVGKKGVKTDLSEDQQIVHRNISLLIKRMNDALTRDDYAGVLHTSASIFETLAKDIVCIPTVQNQTFKSFFDRYRKDSALPDEILDYILAIYESRNSTPLAGHGSTQVPNIRKEEATTLSEITKAFVRIEYKLRKQP